MVLPPFSKGADQGQEDATFAEAGSVRVAIAPSAFLFALVLFAEPARAKAVEILLLAGGAQQLMAASPDAQLDTSSVMHDHHPDQQQQQQQQLRGDPGQPIPAVASDNQQGSVVIIGDCLQGLGQPLYEGTTGHHVQVSFRWVLDSVSITCAGS
jgi:hypothetical protein